MNQKSQLNLSQSSSARDRLETSAVNESVKAGAALRQSKEDSITIVDQDQLGINQDANEADDHQDKATRKLKQSEEFQKRYIEINTLTAGKSFGDLALLGSKPRMASIRCLEDTHFAVLTKHDFNIVLGQIEKKKMNEKIQFLRSLPFFSQLTKTSVSKLTYQFKEVNTIKNQVLYKEGDLADLIYIVKSG